MGGDALSAFFSHVIGSLWGFCHLGTKQHRRIVSYLIILVIHSWWQKKSPRWATKKKTLTFQAPGCWMGILLMVYEMIPIYLGRVVIPYIPSTTRGPFFIAQARRCWHLSFFISWERKTPRLQVDKSSHRKVRLGTPCSLFSLGQRTMEHNHGGLEDHFPFLSWVICRFHVNLPGGIFCTGYVILKSLQAIYCLSIYIYIYIWNKCIQTWCSE